MIWLHKSRCINRTTAEIQHSFVVLLLHIRTSFKSLYCKTALPPNIWPSCSWGPGLTPWKQKSVTKLILITAGSSFTQQLNCLIMQEGCFSLTHFSNRRKLMSFKENHLFCFHIMVYILNICIQVFCWPFCPAVIAFKNRHTF